MNKTMQLIVVLAVLAGAVYFYMQRRVTFTPVSAVSSKMTIGKKAFGTQYDGAAEKDSPLVFFVPADRAGGFTLGRFEKASEGKQGYGIRFGNGDDNFIINAYPVILKWADILWTAVGVALVGYLIALLPSFLKTNDNP